MRRRQGDRPVAVGRIVGGGRGEGGVGQRQPRDRVGDGRRCRGEHQRRGGVGEQRGPAGRRGGRVERQICGAGLERGQPGDDQVDPAVEGEGHQGARSEAAGQQRMRELVGARIQRGVGHPRLAGADSHRVRRARDLRLDERRQQHRRRRGLRPRARRLQRRAPFLSGQDVELMHRAVRGVEGGHEEALETRRERTSCSRIEPVEAVFEHAGQSCRLAQRTAPLEERQRQIQLREIEIQRFDFRSQPSQRQRHARLVLQNEHHLEERMPREQSCRLEGFDELLEWHVLAGVRVERHGSRPSDQRAKARIAGDIRTQHERVHEEAHEVFEAFLTAARDRRADRDVLAGAESREQACQRRLQDHEHARGLALSQGDDAAVQVGDEVERDAAPAIGGCRRSGTVGRQRQLLWSVS